MGKLILSISLIFAASVGFTHAQNVFKKHGFDKKPLTFTDGRYNEFFNNPEVVQVGTVLFNTRTNKVVKLLDENIPKTTYKAEFSSMCLDPMAEKYYSISPYAYCAGNPVRYIDVQGKWIQDSNGGHAYRNGQWSNNTSMGTRTIGNGMQLTPIGRAQFNTMQNASYPVKFTLAPGDGGTNNAGYNYKTVNGKIVSAEIIVYAGNAKTTLDKVNAVVNNPNAVVRADAGADDKARVANPPKTMDEVIGQEAVHETTHLTRGNLSDNSSKDYNVREGEPNNAEIEAVKQTPENRVEPIPTPVVGIKIEPTK